MYLKEVSKLTNEALVAITAGMKKRQNLVNHVMACRAQGPGFGDRRPAGPVNTACVIRIGDVRRVWEIEVGGKVPFEVAGGEV